MLPRNPWMAPENCVGSARIPTYVEHAEKTAQARLQATFRRIRCPAYRAVPVFRAFLAALEIELGSHMRGLTLFRSTLLLPLAVPIIALLLRLEIAGFLGIATFVIAGPYTIFSLWAWRRMGRYSSYKEAYIFLAKAPIIFAVSICSLWLLGLIAIGTAFSIAFKSTSEIFLVLLGTGYLYSVIAAVIAMNAKFVGIAGEYVDHEPTEP